MPGPYFLPSVNTSGVITLKAPFAALCAANVPYNVAGVRTLADIVAAGQDPYGLYYEPYQLDQATFNADVKDGVCILSLKSPSGEWVYVPNSYLVNAPVATGIPYASMLVGVKLGAIPQSLSLAYFMNAVQELAHDLLGVSNAEVMPVKNSTTTYISLDDSRAIELARANVMQSVVTDAAKLRTSEIERLKAIARIAELEAYILAHQ